MQPFIQNLAGALYSPKRMYNEMLGLNGNVYTRNLFFFIEADVEPIDDSVFTAAANVPQGVPMVDRNSGVGDPKFE